MKAVEELEKHQKLLADAFSSDEETDDEMNGIPNHFEDVRVSLTRISELNFDEGNRNVPAILPVTRLLIITQRKYLFEYTYFRSALMKRLQRLCLLLLAHGSNCLNPVPM